MKRKNRIIQKGYDFEVMYNWDCLQRIVRHPKYKKLCEYLKFDKYGFALKKDSLFSDTSSVDRNWEQFKLSAFGEYKELAKIDPDGAAKYESKHPQQEAEFLKHLFEEAKSKTALQEKLLERIRSRFGLVNPMQPDFVVKRKYPPAIKHDDGREESLFSAMPIFERSPFAVSFLSSRSKEDKDGKILLNPIHQGHFLVLKIDVAAHFRSQIVSGVKELIDIHRGMIKRKHKIGNPCRHIKQSLQGSGDEMLMIFKIDLLADDKDILRELHKAISPNKNRYPLEKRINYYEIWDRRTELLPFSAIAQMYSIEEDTAKKRFQSAFELIFDRKYYRDLWRKLFSGKPKYRPFLVHSSEIKDRGSEFEGGKPRDFIETRKETNLSFEDDHLARGYLLDLQRMCSNCSDIKCKENDCIEKYKYCPQAIEYLTDLEPYKIVAYLK